MKAAPAEAMDVEITNLKRIEKSIPYVYFILSLEECVR